MHAPSRGSLVATLAAAVALAGCNSAQRDLERARADAERAREAAGTGALSEAEFAALHDLSDAATPEPRGTMVRLPNGTPAYLALPDGAEAPLPAIVVIHEWWGLNRHVRHWTDRLAADGYAALAVDLYRGNVAEDRDAATALMQAVDDAQALADLAAAHRFLRTDPRVQATRTGVIGWCFGGAWSLRSAIELEGLDAAVLYYGHLVTDPDALRRIDAPLLAVFGTRDASIPGATVDVFEKALEQAGVAHEVLRYDAEHAFANPSGARYDAEAAGDAWRRVRAFLARHVKGDAGA